ncbi:MAG: hypothetical protein U0792_13145 [Gemmataceae bacterium]
MRTAKPRPPLFRALGESDPPAEIVVEGHTYTRFEIYKHDSWAATARYSGTHGHIVCKFNRTQPIGLLSMQWLGNRLAAREHRALTRLADLEAFPRPLGPVYVEGKLQRNAIARSYISGHPLALGERVSPRFFLSLRTTLSEMHSRGIAYVDLHKRENIIVGDDGRPYLVDFQICFDVTHPRVRWLPGIDRVFDALCAGDRYHLDKHAFREVRGTAAPQPAIPTWLQLHRLIAVPFRQLRRRMLVTKGIRLGRGAVSTEAFAEDAVRRESASHAA